MSNVRGIAEAEAFLHETGSMERKYYESAGKTQISN